MNKIKFVIAILSCGPMWLSVGANASLTDRASDPAMVLPLWHGPAPGFEQAGQVETTMVLPLGNQPSVVRNVVKPTLAVYLPAPELATGTGIIIAPGGGFRFLTMGAEGHDVARWLVARGIAAFVLKYRLVETPEDDAEMVTEVKLAFSGQGKRPFKPTQDGRHGIEDGKRAMDIVHARAPEWGLSRIGFMGFSAGAMVASHVALEAPEDRRPRFVAPIYGAPLGEMSAIPASMPPVFLAYSSDDGIVVEKVQAFYTALRKAGHHPELHVYRDGGHGYGLNKQGKSSDFWVEDFYHWLQSLGMTERAAAEPAPLP